MFQGIRCPVVAVMPRNVIRESYMEVVVDVKIGRSAFQLVDGEVGAGAVERVRPCIAKQALESMRQRSLKAHLEGLIVCTCAIGC